MNLDHYMQASGTDYIRAMFENTEDGVLTMETEGENPTCYLLDWDEKTMEDMVTRYETLLAALTELGQIHARGEDFTSGLPEDLQAVYDTYVMPYPDHGMDRDALLRATMKAEFDDPLTEEEEAMLANRTCWLHKNALTRLPCDRCEPVYLINRAMRYEKLVSLKAPEPVVRNEERSLARELVLYHCTKK